MTTEFEEGLLVGVLVGEGHFGGDGRQPHVTLRMHERHAPLFRWIERALPGGRLYGPYDHGGRRYYQWMARGAFLRDVLLPILDRRLTPDIDAYAHSRFLEMRRQYSRQLGLRAASGEPLGTRQGGSPEHTEERPQAVHQQDAAERIFSDLRRGSDGSGPV
jgi:hypothetical protein